MHNLIAGEVILQKVLDRSTPYHSPHSTEILGLSNTTLGDDRFYNNLFVAPEDSLDSDQWSGLNAYNHMDYEFPVYMGHNVYYDGLVPFAGEAGMRICGSSPAELKLEEQDGDLYLNITLAPPDPELIRPLINTDYLSSSLRTGQAWENPDGSPLQIDSDYFGTKRNLENPSAGPFEEPGSGKLRLQVWKGI